MTVPGAETLSHLDVSGRSIAVRAIPGQSPGVVWLGGFKSDMMGGKAQALADWAVRRGQNYVRFD